jgi:hypothetical protein
MTGMSKKVEPTGASAATSFGEQLGSFLALAASARLVRSEQFTSMPPLADKVSMESDDTRSQGKQPSEIAATAAPASHPYTGPDRRAGGRRQNLLDRRSGLDRRRGPGRRRSDDRRAAEEGEMTDEQFEFIMAVNEYKRVNKRPFPTWTEILDVIRALGYRKVAERQDIR